ncbi:uncharacterized protein LOC119570720 isoform X1 [Penaeus monodon]|uniref:uncharacterized protein LOC119570720 isoform X1 n=1 Tax=Penaeus monodon TaxID=6687 RepID=UPI0018A723FF|nr:uncharacterized protein LOC119570720 isoform X1 [Penaeus monodon]
MRLFLFLVVITLIEGSRYKGDGAIEGGKGTHSKQPRDKNEMERKETKVSRNIGVSKRAEGVNVLMNDVCGDQITLGHNESVIIYSNNDRQSRSCKLNVKAPQGSEIGFSCVSFNIFSGSCKTESLEVIYKVNSEKTSIKYCEVRESSRHGRSNTKTASRYKRKDLNSQPLFGDSSA